MTGFTVTTWAGFWTPVMLALSLVIIVIMIYAIRSTGNRRYKKGTEQAVPFFSGNVPPEGNIGPGNLYWGFFKAMERHYGFFRKVHNGIVNDYVYSLVVLVLVIFAVLFLGGVI